MVSLVQPMETELERQLRELNEELQHERLKNGVLMEALRGNKA